MWAVHMQTASAMDCFHAISYWVLADHYSRKSSFPVLFGKVIQCIWLKQIAAAVQLIRTAGLPTGPHITLTLLLEWRIVSFT